MKNDNELRCLHQGIEKLDKSDMKKITGAVAKFKAGKSLGDSVNAKCMDDKETIS